MEINDAYMADNIQAHDAALNPEEMTEVQTVVEMLYEDRLKELIEQMVEEDLAMERRDRTPLQPDDVKELWTELCAHSFMAGMTYRSQGAQTFAVDMTPAMANAFIQFLADQVEGR